MEIHVLADVPINCLIITSTILSHWPARH